MEVYAYEKTSEGNPHEFIFMESFSSSDIEFALANDYAKEGTLRYDPSPSLRLTIVQLEPEGREINEANGRMSLVRGSVLIAPPEFV